MKNSQIFREAAHRIVAIPEEEYQGHDLEFSCNAVSAVDAEFRGHHPSDSPAREHYVKLYRERVKDDWINILTVEHAAYLLGWPVQHFRAFMMHMAAEEAEAWNE